MGGKCKQHTTIVRAGTQAGKVYVFANNQCYFIYIEIFINRYFKNDLKQIARAILLIINYSEIYIFCWSACRATRASCVEKLRSFLSFTGSRTDRKESPTLNFPEAVINLRNKFA